ncbi:MAG: hypothetical protein H0V82_07140 [Candidatus Protochlamydia sp.]|nr:hypothetical protein [Candidatus Protochlamydia sp.]
MHLPLAILPDGWHSLFERSQESTDFYAQEDFNVLDTEILLLCQTFNHGNFSIFMENHPIQKIQMKEGPALYPSELKNWIWTSVKAPAVAGSKTTPYYNIGSF